MRFSWNKTKAAKAGGGTAVRAAALIWAASTAWASPALTPTSVQPLPSPQNLSSLPATEQALTPDARDTLAWVLASNDHGGQPFMVVDKRQARVFVFNGKGRLRGTAPALLGMAIGDVDAPGVGLKPVAQITPAERITPSGRFASEPGVGLQGDAIVWLDYDAGLALHRVRPGLQQAERAQRLAAPVPAGPAASRVSLGCVVLSPAFFDAVVLPTLGAQAGVVYILPETRSVRDWLRQAQLAAAEP